MGSLCGKPSISLLPGGGGGGGSSSSSGPGRTLGGGSPRGYGEIDSGEQPAPPNARVAAAAAAEQRNTSTAQKGKLGAKLEQQKRKTQSQVLQEGARRQPEQVVWD